MRGDLVTLVPVTEAHVGELRRIIGTAEVSARWGSVEDSPTWPFDDRTVACFTVLEGQVVRGMVQYGEEEDPMYRHASVDLFLDPAAHGRGLGTDTVRTMARHLIHDRDHHRLVIDPAADNEAAIRCYKAVGFREVGIMRGYERGTDGKGWHDGLLMDLLAEDLT